MLRILKQRSFINGKVFSLACNDSKKIESTITCLPLHTELRGINKNSRDNRVKSYKENFDYWDEKVMIGLSTQSGCPVMCKFCEVNNLTKKQGWRNLTTEEIFEQYKIMLEQIKEIKKDFHKPELFRILMTRMGEPSYNIDNLISAIMMILDDVKDKYGQNYISNNLRIQISTIGIRESELLVDKLMELEDSLNNYNLFELQFSIHSTDMNFRRWLQNKNVLTNTEINKIIEKFYFKAPRKWKVTLNFTLTNKTPFSIKDLKRQFNPECVFIKLSPLNENNTSSENHLLTIIPQYNKI